MSNPFFYLWDNSRYAGSTNLTEVVNMLHGLEEKSDVPSEAVIKMAEELMPYLEAEREDCPEWFESLQFFLKRAQHNTKAVLRLEYPEVDWPRLLQIMIPLAGKHNVGMFFDADGMFALPPGYIYPIPARYMWDKTFKKSQKTDNEIPKTTKAFSAWFGKQFHEMLSKYGNFEIYDEEEESTHGSRTIIRHYARRDCFMQHDFLIDYSKSRSGYRISVLYTIMSEKVGSILGRFRFHAPENVVRFIADSAVYTGNDDANIIGSINDAERTIKLYGDFFAPILRNINTLGDLNEVMNYYILPQLVREGGSLMKNPHRLVLAKLCEDKNFEIFCDSLNVKGDTYKHFDGQLWDEDWPKLVAFLKESVQPIV